MAEFKAAGMEYEERMARLEEITLAQPPARTRGRGLRDLPPRSSVGGLDTAVAEICPSGGARTGHDVQRVDLPPRPGSQRGASCCATCRTAIARCAAACQALLDHPEISAITERLRTMIRDTDSSLLDEWAALAQGPADEPVAP